MPNRKFIFINLIDDLDMFENDVVNELTKY